MPVQYRSRRIISSLAILLLPVGFVLLLAVAANWFSHSSDTASKVGPLPSMDPGVLSPPSLPSPSLPLRALTLSRSSVMPLSLTLPTARSMCSVGDMAPMGRIGLSPISWSTLLKLIPSP